MEQYYDLGTQCTFQQLPKALTDTVASLGLEPGTVRLPHNTTEVQLTIGSSNIKSSIDPDMFWTEKFILRNLPALQSGALKSERALLLIVSNPDTHKFDIPTACNNYMLLGPVALFDLPFWAPDLNLPTDAGIANNYNHDFLDCWTSERFFQELCNPTGAKYLFVPHGLSVSSVDSTVQFQNLYRHRFAQHPFYTSMLRDIKSRWDFRARQKRAVVKYISEFMDTFKTLLVCNAAQFNVVIRWEESDENLRAPLRVDGTCSPDPVLARNIVYASLPHRYLLRRYRKYFTNVDFSMDCHGYISYALELTPDWYMFGINR